MIKIAPILKIGVGAGLVGGLFYPSSKLYFKARYYRTWNRINH